ncbi:MAG: haloacid dehalogenase-like hydrolase [Thermodesulfobacteriota bacterium]
MKPPATVRRPVLVLLCLLLALMAAAPAFAAQELPSWREPLRGRLLDYVNAVTTPGHQDFIPPAERIASFDLDGTIISEKPYFFTMAISVAWLKDNCGAFAAKGERQAALCQAAISGDRQFLMRNIDALLTQPFLGMDLDAYRALSLKVFREGINSAKKVPWSQLIYQPQLELIQLLTRKGFKVYVCSGSAIMALMAISEPYLGVPAERCIGTRFAATVSEKDGRLVFSRGRVQPGMLNLDQVKAVNLKLRLGRGPVLAFGNTMGDAWMLRFAASSPRRSLALVLDHDDPREFVYRSANLLALAKQRGWVVVSMQRDWARVFRQGP